MRIAYFTDSYQPYISGVVHSIDTFAAELSALGHQVYIFGPRYYRGLRRQAEPRAPDSPQVRVFRFWSVPVPTYAGFTLPVPISPHLDGLLTQLGVEIVHTQSPFLMGLLGAALARRKGLPLVFTHHSLYHEYVHYVPGMRTLARALVLRYVASYCKRCQLVVAPTPQIREFILATYRPRAPVVAIPTGVHLEAFRGGDPRWLRQRLAVDGAAPVLLFVGRLGVEKNVELLLRAFTMVRDRLPAARLALVGDGPDRARLERLSRELGCSGAVTFLGALPRSEVAHCYAGADLFVFPSTTETQGLATLEAMAARVPVVAVAGPGTRDLVVDGVHGYLTRAAPEALAARAAELLLDPERRRRLGNQAALRAESFSSRSMALKLAEAYRCVLALRPGSEPGEGEGFQETDGATGVLGG